MPLCVMNVDTGSPLIFGGGCLFSNAVRMDSYLRSFKSSLRISAISREVKLVPGE